MNITILVSTTDSNILNNKDLLEIKTSERLRLIVVNQLIKTKKPLQISKEFCTVINSNSKGLSKSRNIALENVESGIALFADDDVKYLEGFDKTIRESFKKYNENSVITFKIKTPEGTAYKNYKNQPFIHNKWSILKCSSIEIAFNVNKVKQAEVLFDERFGLGAKHPSGEENVFLTDLLKRGHKMVFANKFIVEHENESSGKKLTEALFYHKGAVIKRIFGKLGLLIIIAFCVKKQLETNRKNIKALINNIKAGLKGFYSFRK